ncbi:glycoside hydrolase family 104 protein [Citrobacter sp. Cf140]|uniref:glycoside hydrolase family 24 protein n=1 Tax=Citrobacter TaxID=544 RepID=UPI001A30ACDB|nr:glycoside hydrolase family 104 protein [Citrobacter sp. Cf140]MEB1122489.1 glycoside hydrolase family 104 protein [Citrobacter freundii]MDM3100027.1 glycoside hydrolase family 104 protein [Citrobacter sp. Cf140]HAU5660008.1 glycoside hydrolase family 104 protein [Citrobacter freundii]HBV7900242.1 glycoside hydrolase family 104 protein [Citrobacter freundii]HCB2471293.1 glycoside hydrolase family 104 protein [Citrobacter freundii]
MQISKNLQALLDALAWSEGTSISPATKCNGYDVIVTGIDGKPEIFTDFSDHPFNKGRPSKQINSRGLTSNASGRYQFMLKDWAHYKALLRLPDFGPESQDKWAIQLIKERKALADIEAGNIVSAVNKCRNIWASLPGAGYGQREHNMDDLIARYKASGGLVT